MFDLIKKKALRGRRFSSNEFTGMVQNWLKMQLKNFFLTEFKKCVKCWNHCVEVQGDYDENISFISVYLQ
jgi:hypothetical protein